MGSLFGAVYDAIIEVGRKQLSLVAAGIAFYMLLSIFPGTAVFVAVYGLVADPASIRELLDELAPFAPPEALALVRQVVDKTLDDGMQLGLTAVVSFAIALWSAGSAVRALMAALQLSFPQTHAYGIIVFAALSLVFTLIGILLAALVISILIFIPIAFETLRAIDTDNRLELGWQALKALEPLILVIIGLAILTPVYWFGSVRRRGTIRFAAYAALTTTALWIAASRILSVYISKFADFNAVYGPLGAVAGLMLWFWISAFLLLLGFELTATLAHRLKGIDKPEADEDAPPAEEPGTEEVETPAPEST